MQLDHQARSEHEKQLVQVTSEDDYAAWMVGEEVATSNGS